MAVIEICNLLRGLFSTFLRSSLNTFLLTFLDLFFAPATPVRIFCPFNRIYLHLQMLSSKIGEQGSPCSSIFFSALTEGHCTPRGRVGSIRYVDYHRPLLRCLLSAFSGRVLSITAGVNYVS